VEGVPFEILDPKRMQEEKNALTLRGGLAEGWESHSYPQSVEIPLGYALARLHVLGGIAAWGYPYTGERAPCVRLTWNYADGTSEEKVLTDGTEFADWIGRHDVEGSQWVDVLAEESWGQVRRFSVAPARSDTVVRSITLASFDNYLAPTFIALTAELPGTPAASPAVAPSNTTQATARPAPSEAAASPAAVLLFGGGSSHDFPRWFHIEDQKTLAELGKSIVYSDRPTELAQLLAGPTLPEVLVLSNNQPLPDPALRQRIFEFVSQGGGLVLLHPATWFNWSDWPEYNRELVGGGSRSHENYADFAVRISAAHEITAGVPPSFTIRDELYRVELDAAATAGQVLATGTSLTTGAEYPVLWTRTHGQGRIVCLTLGHDGAAHELPAFRQLLQNAVLWALRASER
jgi:type 1 glutamine amidotransferase